MKKRIERYIIHENTKNVILCKINDNSLRHYNFSKKIAQVTSTINEALKQTVK